MGKRLDPFYRVPVVPLRSIEEFYLPSEEEILTFNIGSGLRAHVMARGPLPGWNPSDGLQVSLPGARGRSSTLPYFVRAATLRASNAPFLLFSDPTYSLIPEISLAWFLGDASTDLDAMVVECVESARQASNAALSVISGASGGGFTAMRIAPRLRSAVIVAVNPQTDTFTYSARLCEQILAVGYGGATPAQARREWPARFSIAEAWAAASPHESVHVTYVQNQNDLSHMKLHMAPLLEAVESGRGPHPFATRLYDGRPGHTPLGIGEWGDYISEAVSTWHGRSPRRVSERSSLGTTKRAKNVRLRTVLGGASGQGTLRVVGAASAPYSLSRVSGDQPPIIEFATATRVDRHPRLPPRTLAPSTGRHLLLGDAGTSLHPGLTTTWHVGDRRHDLLDALASLVQQVGDRDGSTRLAGRGAGGYAALQVALRVGHGHVLALAPDLAVGGSYGGLRKRYVETAFGEADPGLDECHKFDLNSAVEAFGSGEVKAIIGYDTSNSTYVREQLPQLRTFAARMGGSDSVVLVPYRTGLYRTARPRTDQIEVATEMTASFMKLGIDWPIEFSS